MKRIIAVFICVFVALSALALVPSAGVEWTTEVNIGFGGNPEGTWNTPGEGGQILDHADGKSVLALCTAPGGYFECTVTGTAVEVYNIVANDTVTNKLDIFIDGALVQQVDDRQPFTVTKDDLSNGQHTVKVAVNDETSTDHANKYMFYLSGIRAGVKSQWEDIALDASNVTYEAPSGGEVQKNIVIEVGAPLNVSILPDQDDAYCEVTFTGTAFRLYMLCNVQDDGASVYNAPALKVYIDGAEAGVIDMTDINKYYWKAAADLVWEKTDLSAGQHTIKFVNARTDAVDMRAAYFMGFQYIPSADNGGNEGGNTNTNPGTADMIVMIAVAAAASGAGVVLSRKKKSK